MKKVDLKYVHQGISVFNMDESVEWYKKIFDAEVLRDYIHEYVNCRIVLLKAGEAFFELLEYLGADKEPIPENRRDSRLDLRIGGTKHVCYSVESMPDFFREKVIPYNVEIDNGPRREKDNYMAFIRDNSGICIELYDIGGAIREPDAFQ